jgi:Mg-chelatase subunit ChlD
MDASLSERLLGYLRGLSLAAAPDRLVWPALALAVAAAALVFLALRSRLMMRRRQRLLLVVLTLLSLVLLAASFGELTHTKKEKKLAVALVVDASASVPDQELARARQWLEQAYARRGETWMRTIVFGRTPQLLSPTGDAAGEIARPEKPGTDIARALHTAVELFPDQAVRRAVLFTDGNQTDGDLLAEASILAAHGIELDTVPLDTRAVYDAYVEALHVPAAARPGERVQVGVTIVSNYTVTAQVAVTRGGERIFSQQAQLQPGRNDFETDALVTGQDVNVFVATVNAPQDQDADNNRLSASLRVVAKPRVVLFAPEPDAELPLVEALNNARLEVRVANVAALPDSSAALLAYDEVILSDLDYRSLPDKKQNALMTYAREGGGGVLIIGGTNTAELAQQKLKAPIKKMMPVVFKKKKKTDPNPIALVLVIDKSASMGRDHKFEMAVQAACDVIDLMTEKSRVGVIFFDDAPRWAIQMQPVGNAENREKMKAEMRTFGVDGGTSIYPAIAEAYKKLKLETAKIRHVILLSDGISLTTFSQWGHIIKWMADKKITVSTVALGRESDREHLRRIAEVGQGRFYYTEDVNDIPRIFLEEHKSVTQTNVVEKKIMPALLRRGDLLANIQLPPIPELTGYNSSEPKPTSEVFLTAEGEPLLVRWRYGLGRVTLLATDTGRRWAQTWRSWSEFAALMANLVRGTLPDLALRNYRLQAAAADDRARVSVDVTDQFGNFVNDQTLALHVTDPEGRRLPDVTLEQARPGGYEGAFPVAAFGSYSLRVEPRGAQAARAQGVGQVNLTPPREFIATTPNVTLLDQATKVGRGKANPTPAEVLAEPKFDFPRREPLWNDLLYAALGLVLLTLLVRRS